MKLFAESRGYTVTTTYNQNIAGYKGNPAGFTYEQYKKEIDEDHPVLIQLYTQGVGGHTMLGVGYSGTNQILVHDTWDLTEHTMTWGGSYGGMAHDSVTVFHLAPNGGTTPTVTSITPTSGNNTGSVSITNLAGTNFANEATVLLTRSGSANISATGVTVVSPTRITCTLPLSGTTEGKYNVVVRNLNGKEGVLSNGFTITSPGSVPTISSIIPSYGAKTGSVSITNLAGTNFVNGATVHMSGPAGGSINPIHKGSITNGTGGSLLDLPESVFVSGNYAYVVGTYGSALEIVDVSNPANPVHEGSITDGTGGAQLSSPNDVFVSGNYAYIVKSDGLEIIDVSNPANPVHKGRLI